MTTGELLPTRGFGRRPGQSARSNDDVAISMQTAVMAVAAPQTVATCTPRDWERSAKRMLDVIGSLIGLITLLPLMLIAALLVKVTSSGPALYRQERIGLHGQRFRVWKFRSMRIGSDDRVAELMAEHGGYVPYYKMREDPRITPFGRFLRKSSIDELPQLINVLKGEMSLIGPRPHVRAEVAQYAPEHHRRLFVKPGITGLWQVSGRSDVPRCEAVLLDLQYVDTWSLGGDLRILVKTAKAVATARGAY
jgi:exopolysaccharide biosynthesis polyprenyl glycosylphosphotransferase